MAGVQTFTVTAPDGRVLDVTGDHMPTESELKDIFAKVGSGPSVPSVTPRSNLDRVADWAPTVAGGIGGVAGGLPGAILGGASGEGYKQLLQHLTELPGAAADVARNTIAQPLATAKGAIAGVGEGLKDSGLQAALQGIYELGGRAVGAGLSAGGRAVYRGYLKPSLSAPLLNEAKQIVETGIREAIPVTEGGAAKARGLISTLGDEVDRILRNSPGTVDLRDVGDQVRDFARRTYYRPGQSMADFDAAMKVADELDRHSSLPTRPGAPVAHTTQSSIVNASGQPITTTRMVPGQPVPVTDVAASTANDLKRGLYRSIGENNFGVERGSTKTAQKVAASGIRQGIENVAPEVGAVNERQGNLMALADAVDRAVGREANRNQLFGVPSLLSAGAGASEMLRGNRYAAGAITLATRMGLTPAVATRAAIWAAKMGDAMPGTAVADVARIAVQAMSEAGQDAQK